MRTFARTFAVAMALALGLAGPAVASASRVETLTLHSEALAADAQVNVLLPTGYDDESSRRYPVLYLLHGGSEDHHYWAERVELQALVGDRRWIVVMPDGGSNGFYTDWWNGGAGGPPRWESFHIGELLPEIDRRYRTIPDRSARAVAGVSMGGFGAMAWAARHPDLFGAAASMSGMVNTREPGETMITVGLANNVFGSPISNTVYWAGHNPTDLAGNLGATALELSTGTGQPDAQDAQDMNAFVTAGVLLEGDIKQGNDQFAAALTSAGVPYEYTTYPGVHHIRYFTAELRDYVIPFLDRAFATPRPWPSHWSFQAIEPSFSVWNWQFSVARPAREFLRLTNVSAGGLTATGSGVVHVRTAPLYDAGTVYRVGNVPVTADADGRLAFDVDLGPGHTVDEYQSEQQARAAADPGYWHTATVAIERES